MEATNAAEYLEKHNIYGMFEELMQQLIIHKPEDPLEFLITQLNKPSGKVAAIQRSAFAYFFSSKGYCGWSSCFWKRNTV